MAIYKGYIKEVDRRNTDWGTMVNIKLHTGDTIGFGKFPPKNLNEGDYVQVEANRNDKGYLNAKSKDFKVLPKPEGEGESVATSAASVAGKASFGKEEYWRGKETRDIVNDKARNIGAARNTAIAWLDFLVKNAAVKVSTKKDEAEDQYNTLLDEYTKKFMIGFEEDKNNGDTTEDAGRVSGGAEPAEGDDAGDWNA